MESFRILVCIACLAVCAVSAQPAPADPKNIPVQQSELKAESNQAFQPAAVAEEHGLREKKQALYPVAYSAGYPYYSGYGYAYPYAYSAYAYGAYDDGKYYPGKYEKPYLYRSYPGYYNSPYSYYY